MSKRYPLRLADTAGNGQDGKTVKMLRHVDSALLGTFIPVGGGTGEYYLDVDTTNKVKIEIDGVVPTKLDGIMVVADDYVITTNLAAYDGPGAGSTLIGIYDSAARIAGHTVEDAIAAMALTSELAATGTPSGADGVGVRDTGSYYSHANVEAILQDLGPIFAALSGLTASASELNKLDGADSSVTAINLSSLCNGGSGDVLHTHDLRYYTETELGSSGVPALVTGKNDGTDGRILTPDCAAANSDLLFLPGFNSGGLRRSSVLFDLSTGSGGANGGNFDINCLATAGGVSGKVRINYPTVGYQQVMTEKEVGDRTWAAYPVIAAATTVSDALRLLARNTLQAFQQTGYSRMVFFSGGLNATTANGDTAADPAATVKWSRTTNSYSTKAQRPFLQYPEERGLVVWLYTRTNGTGKVKLTANGITNTIDVLTSAAFSLQTVTIDLTQAPLSAPQLSTLKIEMQGDNSNALEVNEVIVAFTTL